MCRKSARFKRHHFERIEMVCGTLFAVAAWKALRGNLRGNIRTPHEPRWARLRQAAPER